MILQHLGDVFLSIVCGKNKELTILASITGIINNYYCGIEPWKKIGGLGSQFLDK